MLDRVEKFHTGCALCYHSCGLVASVKDGKLIEVEGQKSHPLNKGRICPKGKATIENIYHADRLKYPYKKEQGKWKRISWDQAISEIASKLNDLKSKHGPSAIAFFCGSIGVENLEMVALTNRFKSALGSANYFSVESVCYRMRIRTRQFTFGKYAVEEMDSPLYVLWGHNPSSSDFPLSLAIEENLKKGSKLIVIDPRKIPLANKADLYFPIRPGTDGALALAMINVLITEKLYDADFVAKWTYGFDRLVPHIQKYTPEWAEKITSVKSDNIRTVAHLLAKTKGSGIYQGTCTQDQCANGSQTDRAIAILQTITGNINVRGGWVINPTLKLNDVSLPSKEKPIGATEYPLFYSMWGRTSPYGVMNMVPESVNDKIRAFIIAGGNPLVTMPDTNALTEAFDKLDLLVVYEQFLTETAQHANYVLPAAHYLECWGLAYNYNVCHGLPYLMLREPAVPPYYETKSIREFYSELANACGFGQLFPWKNDEELVAAEIAVSGIDYKFLRDKREGVYYGSKTYEISEGTFKTPSGKIEIYSKTFEDAGFDPLPTYREPEKSPQGAKWHRLGDKYPLVLATGTRTLNFTNASLHNIKSLQAREQFAMAEIGPVTASSYGIANGDNVIVETDRGFVKMKARVHESIMEGVVLVPHGWPGESNCNRLTDCNCREAIMGYPQWKGLLCSIKKDN